jgi:hypothetical protein
VLPSLIVIGPKESPFKPEVPTVCITPPPGGIEDATVNCCVGNVYSAGVGGNGSCAVINCRSGCEIQDTAAGSLKESGIDDGASSALDRKRLTAEVGVNRRVVGQVEVLVKSADV